MTKKELEMPSSYDYFYYDLTILKDYYDLNVIEQFADSGLNLNFKENIRGISYFLELVLIDIIDHLEGMIQNHNIEDIVIWSNSNLGEEAIRKLTQSEPVLKYVFDFNKLRKEFTSIRTQQDKLNDSQFTKFSELIIKLKTDLEATDKFIIDKLKIERVSSDEKDLILNWFLVKYHYIEGDCSDFLNWDEEKIVSTYPGGAPFFHTMPDEARKSYHLQHPIIKAHNIEYLNGYKICLLFFLNKYVSQENYITSKNMIMQAKKWHEIHQAYGKLIDTTDKPKSLFSPLFKITDKRIIAEVISGAKIKEKYELDLIFRRINNLRIKVIRSDTEIGEHGQQTLFYHTLFGAKYIQGENIEVIEFKQTHPNDNRIEYSYAIFMPISGSISDGSYWLFFDRIALASTNDGYKSTSRYLLDGYLKVLSEKFNYTIKTYEIEGNLLKEYIYHKDLQELRISQLNEKIKTSKGLLGQFIAYLYLAKKHQAKLIDISKNINSTDIDIIAENEDTIFFVQAKSSFPFTNKSVKEIKEHFSIIIKNNSSKKQVQKVLFLINESTNDDEDLEYMDENDLDGLSREDINSHIESIKKDLSAEGIAIASYKDLKQALDSKTYKDFLSKVEGIFDYFEYTNFDEFD